MKAIHEMFEVELKTTEDCYLTVNVRCKTDGTDDLCKDICNLLVNALMNHDEGDFDSLRDEDEDADVFAE